jgi:peptidoglycan/xylan/chitin deacetylase (PgdA/CDA1 family)
VPGCVFVATDFVGTDDRFAHDRDNPAGRFLDVMSWAELNTLKADGWSFGSHTASHARLSECSGDRLRHELDEPRRALREQLGIDAAVIAFPFGHDPDISAEAREAAQGVGHTTMLANQDGENVTGSPSFMLGRFDIGADRIALAWKNEVHGIDMGRLRGLWPA